MSWSEIDKEIIKFENTICFFEDDFQLSSKIKQIDHLPDTKEYLKCLEKKLDKLKGSNSKSNKSKDIIQSLINVRQDTMCNFLKNQDETIDMQLANETTVSNNNYLDKKIHPERQALTKEELQELIKADYLARRTETDSSHQFN